MGLTKRKFAKSAKSSKPKKFIKKGSKRHAPKGSSHARHKRGNSTYNSKSYDSHNAADDEVDKKSENGEESDDSMPEINYHPLQSLLSTFSGVKNRETSATRGSRSEGGVPGVKSSKFSSVESLARADDDEKVKSRSNVVSKRDAPENTEAVNDNQDADVGGDEDGDDCDDKDVNDVKVESEDSVLDDPFHKHFAYDLSASLLESVSCAPMKVKIHNLYWQNLNNLTVEIPIAEKNENLPQQVEPELDDKRNRAEEGEVPSLVQNLNWDKLFVKSQIQNNIKSANKDQLNDCVDEDLTPLQKEIFSVVNNYQDLFYPDRNLINGEEVRFVYCLHAVNHILKTRLRILHHNERLLKKKNQIVPDEFRDQGLVRPKIVMVVPFKESCVRIVNMISRILIKEDKGNVINKTRFYEEFANSELIMPKKNVKPEDYEELFKGNVDDNFKIGLSITKKSLKLFTDFYSSDIIIASPLGLRTVIGAQGDKNRDFDFLASVEVLILDQAELFMMQNWDHLLLVFDHLHLQPKESHGTDFSRIRSWVLNGWSKFYRQTLLFSSILAPEFNALFNRRCFNHAGKVRVVNPVNIGSISSVVVPLSHVFQKFKAESAANACDARFKFFVEKVLPQYKDPNMTGILIYAASYFDFVRIRNYLKREEYSFVQICEYSKDGRIARARDKFFHNETRFLLYSERFHFFRRIKLKGIRHIIFYSLPTFPHFYSELCNQMKEDNQNRLSAKNSVASVIVLYCKYDVHQLSATVKTSRTSALLSSDKDVHMFATG